ncbi:MAG: NAD(P)-dependent glycerol-3-phosphate dehydrogenase [Gammaproteobacteria bacterium]|nr:NAD(P)-dependent glycerol-3-phosphate dehydrogenase [Gammaproteobacteria bacterium]NIR81824.1 NAD(P)-dependent glycerol-3-phosphate dehydrogenase [Gammaproteobacteria bacterium]NIR88656.1 NAD(P)-dependent glycerol-3-phosphate dehydrogenase [Gammaproteobacteria bacterium]NIU02932.1 NAD(P)-dependent glycerol-3-phosphate dehydrogenase [Gammaproteobacteria bacterium]NIV50453.1 NAD(P)H-dependent glycerol-3-phosphate dehydrogenase [Gammaproteobacteria bacterium]
MGSKQRIAVLGAGSWGTALAVLLARNGERVTLWARDREHVVQMQRERCNQRYLPGVGFAAGLSLCADLRAAVSGTRDVLVAVPSHAFRDVLQNLAPVLPANGRLVWATKGFEPGGARLLHEVAESEVGAQVPAAVISGPTFAREVVQGLPTAVTIASRDPAFAEALIARFHNPRFRVYTSPDVVGVEVGGAVKNVLAIAAGIADGLGFGANTRAALITRGLAELMRLGAALGGQPETFMGLAGLGDLVLTCTDDQSRNRRVGLALGRGLSLDEAVASVGQVAEGVRTAREVRRLAARLDVDTPITEQVDRVLHEGIAPAQAVEALLSRAVRSEAG